MTVGITITNGLEAVVITDTRVSGQGRQSDSVNKMGEFSAHNYHGVIFGTGIATLIEGVVTTLRDHEGDNLEDFMQSVHSDYKGRVHAYDSQILESGEVEIRKKARALLPEAQLQDIKLRIQSLVDQKLLSEDQKEGAIRQELSEAVKKHDSFVAQQREILHREYEEAKKNNQTLIVFAAYDSGSGRIRVHQMNERILTEVQLSHVEIGSGSDGANLYFSTKLQGVSTQKLSLPDLAFFACSAYGMSTVNQGVGGTPKIALISKEGVNVLDVSKTRALTNVTGAYLAEINSIPSGDVREIVRSILGAERPKYADIGKKIGVNRDTLTGKYIPYSSWQERANLRSFGDQP